MYKYRLSLAAWIAVVVFYLAMPPGQALALSPDQLALVVNRNEPQGIELAQFYAQSRGIPADRIITIDVPFAEEVTFDRFERQIRPVVRKFLRDRSLQDKVKCLVTFYGVPLRIAERLFIPADNNERERIDAILKQVQPRLVSMVGDIEKQAAEFDPSFKPASPVVTVEALAQRAERAGQAITQSLARSSDPQRRQAILTTANEIKARFAAPVTLEGPAAPATQVSPTTEPLEELLEKPFDRPSREQLRERFRLGGIIGYARILQSQSEYFATAETSSAVDSELALTLWPAYSRTKFQPNLLNLKYRNITGPPTLMVMRLDAPKSQQVRDIIAKSITVEREGLKGKIVVDTRGLPAKDATGKDDAYGVFDESLRRLATFVKTKTKLELKLDEKPEVLPANSVDNVALYCGWYSVRQYVPSMKFVRGAVGYHVASFEMIILHGEGERGWVSGLLNSGITSTLGPVAEPYLASFPPPDEFFPLLMTGKLTLAEVYWTTTPLTSWMQSCIGDPLYNPYEKNPAVQPQDLPEALQSAFTAALK